MLTERALCALRAAVGADVAPLLLAALKADFESAARQLEAAVETGDEASARRVVHKLLGLFAQYAISHDRTAMKRLTKDAVGDWGAECAKLLESCTRLGAEISSVLTRPEAP